MRKSFGLIWIWTIILIIFSVFCHAVEISGEDQIIVFTEINKTDRSIILSLPSNAEVSFFSFELVGPIDSGSNQPWNITLDIGDNGTIDWSLKREYGPLGLQNMFNNSNHGLDLGYLPGNYNRSGGIFLPKNVEVKKASLELVYSDEHYLSPIITELNRPEWHPEAPYDYDPDMCIFRDSLFVAYRSYGWHDTNQSDADIALNSTVDGNRWQNKTIELTKAPDTEVPYLGGRCSGDFRPSLAVFKDKLYCAWESSSPLPIGSTHDSDRDIVWTSFNGTSWRSPEELTAPTSQAAEDVYSKNPGNKDDRSVQLCTFDNGSGEQLFAIWNTNNTGDERFPGEPIRDVIVSKTEDGETWSVGVDLTAGDKRYYMDNRSQLIKFRTSAGNALFAFWVTNNDELTNGSDWDIVYRYTLDGNTWSETHNLIEECGVKESAVKSEIIDDDPAVVVFNRELYVLWRTSNPNISKGTDIDIVMSHTSDGFNWSGPIELTPNTDTLFNNNPKAVGYKDKLVTSWRSVLPDDEGAIIVKVFDAKINEWSETTIISPPGVGGDDYSQDLITFKDKLLVTWVTQDNHTALGNDSDVVVRWLVPRNGTPEIAFDIGSEGDYNENWLMNKAKLSDGTKKTINFTSKLRKLLLDNSWVNSHTIDDEFGNEFYYIPINTYFSSPGRMTLKSLEINYNYTLTLPDLSSRLRDYLKSLNDDDDNKKEDVDIKLRFDSISPGKVKIQNLRIRYSEPDQPDQNPEILCVIIMGILLIVAGLIIRFLKFGPKKSKKKPKEHNNLNK